MANIAQNGLKPIILTNAVALTPELLRELKQAGLAGFTVHITYRTAASDSSIATDAADRQVDLSQLSYVTDHFDEKFVTSPEVYGLLKENLPEYEAVGYLGGSIRHDSYKWLAGALVGSRRQVYGSVGKATMEVAQAGHHLLTGRYLAYLSQAKIGRKVFQLAPWDRTVCQAARRWLADVVRHPARLFDGIYVQSIGIIQAPDLLSDGRADMCDSCPDITYYDGQLVNSCRLDEYRLYGGFLSVIEKKADAALVGRQN